MIFGTDTARYQPLGTYDPGSFEVVNGDDPQLAVKSRRNADDGRPTSIYIWVYSWQTASTLVDRLQDAIERAGVPMTMLSGWWDFETNEDGSVPSGLVLDQALHLARDRGMETGYYGNDFHFDHSTKLGFAYWYAGYPDPNDGRWRDGYAPRARRDVQVFQWASGGGLDRNVIWDEPWYQRVTTGGGAAPAPAAQGDESVIIINLDTHECVWVVGNVFVREFTGPGPFGIPQSAIDFAGAQIPIKAVNGIEYAVLKAASAVAVGRLPDGTVPPVGGGGGAPAPSFVLDGQFKGRAVPG